MKKRSIIVGTAVVILILAGVITTYIFSTTQVVRFTGENENWKCSMTVKPVKKDGRKMYQDTIIFTYNGEREGYHVIKNELKIDGTVRDSAEFLNASRKNYTYGGVTSVPSVTSDSTVIMKIQLDEAAPEEILLKAFK